MFSRWFDAFTDHSPGDPYKEYEVEKFKNGKKKSCHIKITYWGTLNFHLSSAFGGNCIERCFKKKIGKCSGGIVVNRENPFELFYNYRTNLLTVKCKYELFNKFGNKISN